MVLLLCEPFISRTSVAMLVARVPLKIRSRSGTTSKRALPSPSAVHHTRAQMTLVRLTILSSLLQAILPIELLNGRSAQA